MGVCDFCGEEKDNLTQETTMVEEVPFGAGDLEIFWCKDCSPGDRAIAERLHEEIIDCFPNY